MVSDYMRIRMAFGQDKGQTTTVSATEKVMELVSQHPVLYDQHRRDYRDSVVAANIRKRIANPFTRW